MQALKVIFQLFLLCIRVWGWLILAIWGYCDWKKQKEVMFNEGKEEFIKKLEDDEDEQVKFKEAANLYVKIITQENEAKKYYPPTYSILEKKGFVWDEDLKKWKKVEQSV